MNTPSELRAARAGLAFLFEPDSPPLRELVAAGGPVAAYERLHGGNVPRATLRPELRHMPTEQLWARADGVLSDAERYGRVLIPEDPDWPTRLADLGAAGHHTGTSGNAALCLWVRGTGPVALTLWQSVTVIGTEFPTSYGVHAASEFAYQLAREGWTVVSGWAVGIDATAHRGALSADGTVVATLPRGLDTTDLAGDNDWRFRITQSGTMISLWPAGTPATQHRIAANYRLLGALSAGTVVVEAAAHGIETQALREALRLGRPAMVVPGPVTSMLSNGCHQMLRADPRIRLVTGVTDVLDDIDASLHRIIPAMAGTV
jgi:DNA processing protein